jgi:hypothetical protein
VIFAKERGAIWVVFETSCQNLLQMCTMKDEQGSSKIATILKEIPLGLREVVALRTSRLPTAPSLPSVGLWTSRRLARRPL